MNKKSTFILFIVFMIFSFLTCGCGDNSGNDGNYQIYYPWAIAQNEAGEENRAPAPVPTPTVDPTVEPTPTPTVDPTVEPTPTPTVDPTVEPATLELSQSTFNMEVDETDNIVVSLNGNPVENAEFIVVDDSVATVAEDGTITAVGAGTTTVTVRVDGAEDATFTITVTEPVIPDLVLSKNSFEIAFGGNTDNVTVTLDGEDVTQSQNLTYTVADPDIVTVNAGEIKTSSIAYGESVETTVTVHLDGANDATFTVVVTANFSNAQPKSLDQWNGVVFAELYDIGVISSSDRKALTEIKIPAAYKNKNGELCKITQINSSCFDSCSNLKSVTIPGTVTVIEYKAFYNCTNLESLTFIGTGLKTINSNAFEGCTSLTSVELPSSVTEVGYQAFYNCSNLTSLTFIGTGLKTINSNAFEGCTSLTSVELPSSVTEVGYRAFYNCSNLNITIPDSITSVGDQAFSNVDNVNYSGTLHGAPWGAKKLNGNGTTI